MEKLKLFLSYGRADAKEVASRIKEDLEKQDFDVWMDQNEIKAGTAYMTEIEMNLKESNAVIALMSPHSVRSVIDGAINDSVCLDEIAYARDYPGKILPVMVSKCRVPIVLYRLDYVDLCSWKQNDEEYKKGLQRIIEGISATLRNEIHYRTAQKTLEPWDFGPFLSERSKGFIGRDWLFQEVIRWLEGNHCEKALLITADPGVGKSAFVGKWVITNPGGHLLAYHCCQVDSPTTLEPSCFIRSLAAMISSQIPEYEEMLNEENVTKALNEEFCRLDPDSGFGQGIIAPLRRLKPPCDGICCIIVDALDEAILLKERKTIVDILQNHLNEFPDWLRLIATTRNDPSVLDKLAALRAQKINAQDIRNIVDAREYLFQKFSEESLQSLLHISDISLQETVAMLLERSKGNFLYLHYAIEGLMIGSFHIDNPDEFPPGLTGFYEKAFKHRFVSEQEYQPVAGLLSVLLAARQPLDERMLFYASGLSFETDLKKYLKILASYLKEKENTYAFFHRSFAEWLRDKNNLDFHIEPMQGEAKLADLGWNEYKSCGKDLNDYMQKYLPYHLIATNRFEKLTELLTDFNILEIIWENRREHEWMHHWRLIMDKVDVIEAYQKSLDNLSEIESDINRIAKVSGRIGALLCDLGLHDKALPFAVKAVELLKKSDNHNKEELASSLLILAELYRHLCEFEEAEPLYLESLHLQEQIWPDSIEVGKVVYALCVFYNTCTKRDIDKSIYYNEWAIRIQENQSPPQYASLADAVNDKGILLLNKGNVEEALPYYEKAKKLFEEGFPEGHPELAVVLSNIAGYYYGKKNYQRALDLNRQSIEMRSMFVVSYDKKCQGFRRDRIKYYMALMRYTEAQKIAEEIVQIGEKGNRYSIDVKIDDLVMVIVLTLYTQDTKARDKNFKKLFNEIQKDPHIFSSPTGELIVQLFYRTLLNEFENGRNDSAVLFNKIFVNFLTGIQPQPCKTLARYFTLLADIYNKLGATDIEKQCRDTADYWENYGDKRLPYLIKIKEAEELINNREFRKSKELMSDVFTDALINEFEIKDWKPYLCRLANETAIKLKNDHNEYELAEWFYQQGVFLDPKNNLLIGNYAFLLTSVFGKNTEAENYYKKALEINPDDANCLSNYAVYYTNIKKDFEKAEELFSRAYSLKSEDEGSIASNYSALKIIKGDLEIAYNLAEESYKDCLKKPDRMMARSLFCAAAIAAINHKDLSQYLAQMKTLFLMGIQRVPWQANALIEHLKKTIPAREFLLLEALWLEICNKENDLKLFEDWEKLRPMPFDRPWNV
jgi:tetratricopeptide (TPR) repeat protein